MDVRAFERWQCCQCGDLHSSEFSARQCCPPDIRHVWECIHCGEVSAAHDEAALCCDDTPLVTTAAELEAAGQERLL